jgi:hypothetical protein
LQIIDVAFALGGAASEDSDIVTVREEDGRERLTNETTAAGENDAFHNRCGLSAAQP